VLREHSDVGDVAVVGRPSDRTGEQVVAFVVPTPGREPDPVELASFAATRLARYKRPAVVEIVDELPRSVVGKVLRRVLRHQ
jgi:long-chain acyl-CoA synthetase